MTTTTERHLVIDQATKDKWVNALRSKKYRQTRGKLSTTKGYGFCCLGVLADIIGHDEWQPADDQLGGCRSWRGGHGRLPYDILDTSTQMTLTTLNDQDREPFDYIADWVERRVIATPNKIGKATQV